LDLRTELVRAFAGDIDLVTSAAFFDLVSSDWMSAFCAVLTDRNLPLYTTLNYSGEETWGPSHLADAVILAAFHRHQASDKGFGPAAGPAAASILQQMLKERSYCVSAGASIWRLGKKDASVIAALADGIAKAVSESGLVPESAVADWRAARIKAAQCSIGHIDLFAVPMMAPRKKPLTARDSET
jgi:hypothetical protein